MDHGMDVGMNPGLSLMSLSSKIPVPKTLLSDGEELWVWGLGFPGEEEELPCPSRALQGAPGAPWSPPVPPGAPRFPRRCRSRARRCRSSNSISRPHFPLRPSPDGLTLIRLGREARSRWDKAGLEGVLWSGAGLSRHQDPQNGIPGNPDRPGHPGIHGTASQEILIPRAPWDPWNGIQGNPDPLQHWDLWNGIPGNPDPPQHWDPWNGIPGNPDPGSSIPALEEL